MTEAPDETVEKAEEPRPRESADSMPIPLPESLRPYGGVVKRVWAIVPWVSFALGAIGAYIMDRGPDQSWLIALGAIGVWITVLGLRFVSRYERPSLVGAPKAFAVAARISLILATQGLMQLTLFFALPFFFYASAAALDIGHGVFLLLLTAMSLASLWDPLTEKLLKRPLLSSALPAFGSFAALTAVLPSLGLSTQVSLWLAVLSAVIGFPIITAASVEPGQRLKWVSLSCALALLFPLLMYLGAARIVPAAPLRLVDAAIGTELVGRWVKEPVKTLEHVPARLHCATAIASPLGLRDQLFHVWRKDGKERVRIALKIVGGRKQGWRTHSRITPGVPGKYTCTVETASGQSLGSRSVKITGR
jgi:hypothetical protein